MPVGGPGTVGPQEAVQQSILHNARDCEPHYYRSCRRSRTDQSHVLLAGVCTRIQTFQGKVQARQSHPGPHRRKTIPVPISGMWKSVCSK